MKLLSKLILVTTLILFLAGISFFSNLHNHERDFREHNNCPACIFSSTLHKTTVSFSDTVDVDLPLDFKILHIYLPSLKSTDYSSPQNNRAPPIYLS